MCAKNWKMRSTLSVCTRIASRWLLFAYIFLFCHLVFESSSCALWHRNIILCCVVQLEKCHDSKSRAAKISIRFGHYANPLRPLARLNWLHELFIYSDGKCFIFYFLSFSFASFSVAFAFMETRFKQNNEQVFTITTGRWGYWF